MIQLKKKSKQTDGMASGQFLCYRTLPAIAWGPIREENVTYKGDKRITVAIFKLTNVT